MTKNGWYTNIFKEWSHYQNDMLHKDDGPAFFTIKDGRIEWYHRNKRHRIDGPAVEIYPSKEYQWWLDNVVYSFDEWLEKTPLDEEQKLLLKLEYD